MRLLLTFCLVLPLMAASVSAQSDSFVVTDSGPAVLTQSQVESELARLQRDYDDIKLRRARIGLGLSSALLVGGIFPLGIGMAYNLSCELEPGNPSVCRDPFGTGLAVLGGIAMVGGAIGVIITSVRLKKRKEEQRRIRREMLTLKRASGTASEP